MRCRNHITLTQCVSVRPIWLPGNQHSATRAKLQFAPTHSVSVQILPHFQTTKIELVHPTDLPYKLQPKFYLVLFLPYHKDHKRNAKRDPNSQVSQIEKKYKDFMKLRELISEIYFLHFFLTKY